MSRRAQDIWKNGHFEEWKIGDDTFNILIQIIDCYAIIIMDGRLVSAERLSNATLRTSRGKEIIEHENRLYRKESQGNGLRVHKSGRSASVYYVCCGKQGIASCKGRMIEYYCVNMEDGSLCPNPVRTVKEGSHICSASSDIILLKKARRCVEEAVVLNGVGINEAVGDSMTVLRDMVGDLEAAQFGTAFSMRRKVNRMVARVMGQPPSTYAALTSIPEELSVTIRGSEFLLVFSSYVSEDGLDEGTIIVFATKADLLKLFDPSDGVFVVDGTFKIKPQPYAKVNGAQVLTMNTLEGVPTSRRLYRRLLALLPCKSEHCYCEFLKMTLMAAQTKYDIDISSINWRRGMLDFEVSLRTAFKRCTSELLLKPDYVDECCHMHYCSAVIKHIKAVGLGSIYMTTESGLMEVVRKLFALAFLPTRLIQGVYLLIKEQDFIPEMLSYDNFVAFMTYYEQTWLSDNGSFPLECWSVFDRSDDMKRTNNNLEGKHRHYLKVFGVHSNLWSFISRLQSLQEHQECEELQYLGGGTVPAVMRSSDLKKERELAVLKTTFTQSRQTVQDGHDYVKRVSYKMRKYTVNNIDADMNED